MKLLKAIAVPVVFSSLGGMAFNASATGTDAGTKITNTATLSYAVNGVSQANVNAKDDLNVDVKVDFDLARKTQSGASGLLESSLSETNVVVGAYQINNTGNSPVKFKLAAANSAVGTTVNGKASTANNLPTGYKYFVDNNGNGLLDSGENEIAATGGNILTPSVAKDGNVSVLVVLDKSSIQAGDQVIAATTLTVNGFESNFSADVNNDGSATAQTVSLTTESTGANDKLTMQVVWADTDENNTETANDAILFKLGGFGPDPSDPTNPAKNGFIKSSEVVWDPLNAATDPVMIPGAVVKYTITIKNVGSTEATSVKVTDTLPANTTFCATSDASNGNQCADVSATATTTTQTGSTAVTPVLNRTGAGNSTTAFDYTYATFPAKESSTITFYVTIN